MKDEIEMRPRYETPEWTVKCVEVWGLLPGGQMEPR